MSAVAEKWKIVAILNMVKQVRLDDMIVPGLKDPASKTARFLFELGFTRENVYEVLRELTYRDYAHGPLRDEKGRPHDLWIFGKYVEAIETYIKFTVFGKEGTFVGVCVSFHEAEHPLSYPYRKAA